METEVRMGFFNWAAPIFKRWDERWSTDDIARISDQLRPFVDAEGSLLDLGGGTGGLAVRLAEELEACVTILDPTPEMVGYVPKHDRVEVVLGYAEDMPFDDDAFDAIVVSDAFHHFDDPARAADEMARVTRVGGGILVLELDRSHLGVRIAAFLERLLREPAGFVSPEELQDLLRSHGIEGTSATDGGPYFSFHGRVGVRPATDSRRLSRSRDDD